MHRIRCEVKLIGRHNQQSASKRSSASVKTKTSSQRQKDLLLATHRRDELERQNANAIRLAKQKQEVARKQLERKKSGWKKNKFSKELEDENQLKFAEVKLTELDLTDDLSPVTEELRETLSHISKHSKQTTSPRVSDRGNEVNEPDSISNQLQTSSVDFNNAAESSNPTFIPASIDVAQIKQATPPVRSFANVKFGPAQSQIPQSAFRLVLTF